jgi:hypothetical protein
MASNDSMIGNNELENMWKEGAKSYFNVDILSRQLLIGTE